MRKNHAVTITFIIATVVGFSSLTPSTHATVGKRAAARPLALGDTTAGVPLCSVDYGLCAAPVADVAHKQPSPTTQIGYSLANVSRGKGAWMWNDQPKWVRLTFDCIAYAESRDHPYEGPNGEGASGLFQFVPGTWGAIPARFRGPATQAYRASLHRQLIATGWEYLADGFRPWSGDPCLP